MCIFSSPAPPLSTLISACSINRILGSIGTNIYQNKYIMFVRLAGPNSSFAAQLLFALWVVSSTGRVSSRYSQTEWIDWKDLLWQGHSGRALHWWAERRRGHAQETKDLLSVLAPSQYVHNHPCVHVHALKAVVYRIAVKRNSILTELVCTCWTYASLAPRPLPPFQCCTQQHWKGGSSLGTRLDIPHSVMPTNIA